MYASRWAVVGAWEAGGPNSGLYGKSVLSSRAPKNPFVRYLGADSIET